jgi:ubiquitin-conjugating enzyme E2 Q
MLFKHDRVVDDLDDPNRKAALHHLSCNIPSVLEMRKYLMEKPGRLLSSWKNTMDTSTLALLNWIVASNRSLIVQDGPVPDDEPVLNDALAMDALKNGQNGNQVIGMDKEWMQFRFAQGAPEKEQIFTDELNKFGLEEKKYPSLFLWHGSPLRNWHSIIRSGLDFKTSQHGRAYGNGVYFSSHLDVSLGYTGGVIPMRPRGPKVSLGEASQPLHFRHSFVFG